MNLRASLAVPLSFGIFIVAWVFELVVYFGFPYNSTTITAQHLSYLFSCFPWSLLSKGILDLADATTGMSTLISTQSTSAIDLLWYVAIMLWYFYSASLLSFRIMAVRYLVAAP